MFPRPIFSIDMFQLHDSVHVFWTEGATKWQDFKIWIAVKKALLFIFGLFYSVRHYWNSRSILLHGESYFDAQAGEPAHGIPTCGTSVLGL